MFAVPLQDRWYWSAPIFLAVAAAVYGYPLDVLWLAIGLFAYAAILWVYPLAWLIAVPALLPVLDFARWTGRLFFDEFDLLMLVTWGVSLARVPISARQSEFARPFGVLAGLVALSYLVSLGIGLFPLQPWDANAFSNYYSHYNALRVAKGALWAFSLPLLVAGSLTPGVDIRRLFTLGMVAGLAGTVAVVVWERIAFTGLFNFSHDYRVSGPFSVLHVGGASLEGYLVAALPFVGYAIAVVRNPAARLGGLLLFGGGIYGVMVTYSRAGLAAILVMVVLMCMAFALHVLRRESGRVAYLMLGILLATTATAMVVPVLNGSYAQARLAQAEGDLPIRFAHWRDTLTIMDDGWSASLVGMGLGRFPETYFWRTTIGTRPGTYRYEIENGNAFLRLGSGSGVYLDQVIALKPHSPYRLSLDLRSSKSMSGAEFGVPICEIWVRGATQCETPSIRLNDAANIWQHYEVAFNSGNVGARPWYLRGPARLNLHNPTGDATVDVDNVRVIGDDGRDLMTNGGFDSGNDRWWFTVDDHLPWHIKNFWVHIFFEQGWFGLLSIALLTAVAIAVAVKRMWRGDLFAGILVASIAGFLVVGALSSPNDNPELMFLFIVLVWLAFDMKPIIRTPESSQTAQRPSASLPYDVPDGTQTRPRFDELDSLRAIAAIAVVLVHYRIHFNVHPLPGSLNPLADGGDLAVDFFFVLSGFVLCRAYWNENRRFRVFTNLWERVARLYPLVVFTLLLVAFGQWYLQAVLALPPYRYEINDGYHFVLNMLFLNGTGLEKGFSFNAPSWSVSTEFVVNALFLLLIALPRLFALPLVLALAAGAFALLYGAGEILVDNRVLLAEGPVIGMIDAALIRTSLGFFVGVLLWLVTASKIDRVSRRGSRRADLVFLCAGLAVAAIFGSYRIRQAIPSWDFVLLLILFPAIVASATFSQGVRSALRWSPLVLLGHASYSIYLIHFPLQLGLHTLAVGTGIALPYDQLWFLMAFLLSTCVIAVGIYQWIELPAKRRLRALVG